MEKLFVWSMNNVIMVIATHPYEIARKSVIRNNYATTSGLIVTIPANYRCAWSVWCGLVMHY